MSINTALFKKLICIHCCKPTLEEKEDALVCSLCGRKVLVHNNVPDFLSSFRIGKLSWTEKSWDPHAYESTISQTKPYRLKRIDEPLLQYAQGEVLEIGCGTCRLAIPVERRGAEYFGLDPVYPFLLYAYKYRNLQKLVCGQGERLPFQDNSFDCIISGFYAYRYVNPELGLPETRRLLRTNGKFVFDLLNFWILKLMELKRRVMRGEWTSICSFRLKPEQDTFEFINLSQLQQKAEKSGFLIENVISAPVVPIAPSLNRYLSNFYFRGKKTIYLGYDIIVVLRAM